MGAERPVVQRRQRILRQDEAHGAAAVPWPGRGRFSAWYRGASCMIQSPRGRHRMRWPERYQTPVASVSSIIFN